MAAYKLTDYRFEKIIPREAVQAAGLAGVKRTVQIINAQHCKYMVSAGVCTQDCGICKTAILSALDMKGAANPYALLTYRLRVERARMIESHVAENKSDISGAGNFGETPASGLDQLEALFS